MSHFCVLYNFSQSNVVCFDLNVAPSPQSLCLDMCSLALGAVLRGYRSSSVSGLAGGCQSPGHGFGGL